MKKDKTKQKRNITEKKESQKNLKDNSPKRNRIKISKIKLSKESKLLMKILILSFAAIILVIAFSVYLQSLRNPNYNNIKFKAIDFGKPGAPIILYSTLTLARSNGGTGSPFGFRIRTKPSDLKNIKFKDSKNLNLTRVNAYSFGNGTFSCDGNGIIAMVNFERLFKGMGEKIIHTKNFTCDPQGRYNSFYLEYGNKTEIKTIGDNCYDIVIKGNDTPHVKYFQLQKK